jgi:predicted hydrocarbon binding protein
MPPLPLLQRREIEARVLGPVVDALAARFGRDEVLALVAETIRRLAREGGAELAAELGSNTMEDLARVLELWRQDGSLELRVLRQDADHLEFDVTRCRYAEMYRRLGIADLGPILSCSRDFCFSEGFNPDIRLERTQTIMQGASHCDFRFRTASAGGG